MTLNLNFFTSLSTIYKDFNMLSINNGFKIISPHKHMTDAFFSIPTLTKKLTDV